MSMKFHSTTPSTLTAGFSHINTRRVNEGGGIRPKRAQVFSSW